MSNVQTSSLRRRAPRALVVWQPNAAQPPIDWSPWYLRDEDDVGASPEHHDVRRGFYARLSELAKERAWKLRVAEDEFFAWVPDEELVRVSPDVFTQDPVAPPLPSSWRTWRGHPPPRFALEVVSRDWRKDYEENPKKYAQLGCRELVIFDPRAARGATRVRKRIALQVYRRDPDGAFVCCYRGAGPTRSSELGAWLVPRADAPHAELLLARDEHGESLVASAEERATTEARRADTEARRADAAERRLRELERKLAEK